MVSSFYPEPDNIRSADNSDSGHAFFILVALESFPTLRIHKNIASKIIWIKQNNTMRFFR